jgi:D-xylose transport system substrate-binding protein
VQLAGGKKLSEIQGAKPWSLGPKKQNMTALFLTPVAVTKDNLNVVIDAGWVTKDVVCQGVKPGSVKVCN